MNAFHSSTAIPMALFAAALAGCGGEPQSPAEVAEGPSVVSDVQSAAPAFYQLAASGFTSCGVALDQSAWCWGSAYLGDGSADVSSTPIRVAGGLAFKQISTDGSHTCGVTTDFRAFCWGFNFHGSLGDGTAIARPLPTPVAGGLRFSQVNAGQEVTCGVSYPDRAAYCWGLNDAGQLGDGTLTERHTPTRVLGNLTLRHVSAGAGYACAVTTGDRAYCWGSDLFGQLGDNDVSQRHTRPVAVAGGLAFSQLEAGSSHTCAVTTAGVAYCWGYGGLGQLGNGKLLNRFTPRAVKTTVHFRRVAPGSGFTCAETPTSQVYCWGDNEFGQVGDGTTGQRLTPVPVAGGLRFAQVGAGGWNACGRTGDGTGYCWGENLSGTLGDGTTQDRHTPTRIAAPLPPSLRTAATPDRPALPVPLGDTLARSR